MIQFFIKIANSFVGRIILILLFGMVFALGIGGITVTSRSTGYAIKVGSEKLSVQKLDEIFSKERQKLSNLTGGKYISPKQAIEMGLLDKVIRDQAEKMVLDGVKEDLGLAATTAAIQRYLENHPGFKDVNGHFDRALFTAYLRQMGLSEQTMAEQLRNELAIQHLSRAFSGIGYAPQDMVKAVYHYQNEKRDVTAVEIIGDKLKDTKQATEEELKDIYDIYAEEKFMTPEYRSFHYMQLTPTAMLDKVVVSDAEIDAVFDERKVQFETPEKRQISQMFFKDKESADKAMKGLTTKNFDSVAAKNGQDKTSFGYVAAVELMDELAEEAFKAEKGNLIGPIQSTTGWHILWIQDIQKAKTMPEEEMHQAIREQLAQEKTYAKMEEVVRQLEDILGVGDNLEKASKELGIPLKQVNSVDISGAYSDGKMLTGELNNQDLLQSLFTLKTGESTPLMEGKNGFIVAELDDVIPVSVKSFSAVKSDVQKLWSESQRQERVNQALKQVLDRMKNGATMQMQATFFNLPIMHEKDLSRKGTEKIPAAVAMKIFESQDELIQIPTDKGVMLVQINQIIEPDMDQTALEKTQTELKQTISQELYDMILAAYALEMGIDVNQSAIEQNFSIYKTE